MNILGIIPARFASTRFPGKALHVIEGRSMVQRVYEQAMKCADLSKVVVATDHEEIAGHVVSFGGEAVMTSSTHNSGTERCAEALHILTGPGKSTCDGVINIQGDEPFIHPGQISAVAECLRDPSVAIATLARKITSPSDLVDPNVVKVVFNHRNRVLIFSRSAVPFVRTHKISEWLKYMTFFEHIGIYGYRSAVLQQIVRLPDCPLEKAESLEQLRWMFYGIEITVKITDYQSISIDTPADLRKIANRIE